MTTIEVIERLFPKGNKVPLIKGVIRWIGEVKRGTVEKGANKGDPWTIQNFILCDDTKQKEEDYSSIPCGIFGQEELPQSFKNQEVVISCYDGPKGLSGVLVDEYNGEKKLKITRTGRIELATEFFERNEGEGDQSSEQSTSQTAQDAKKADTPEDTRKTTKAPEYAETPPKEKREQPPPTPETAKKVDAVNKVKREVGKMMAIHILCYDAAVAQANRIYLQHGYMHLPSVVERWASNFFANFMRNGNGVLLVNDPDFEFDPYQFIPFEGVTQASLLPLLQDSIDGVRAHNQTLEEVNRANAQMAIEKEKEEKAARDAEKKRLAEIEEKKKKDFELESSPEKEKQPF